MHIGYHLHGRFYMSDNTIPTRGGRRSIEENSALGKGEESFKTALWKTGIPAGKPDPTGCGGSTTTGTIFHYTVFFYGNIFWSVTMW
jgi:hypothetical protein